MTQSDLALVEAIFTQTNAIITNDHFVYAKKPDGWYHGSNYVNKDGIYPFTSAVSSLCRLIACHFKDANIDVVVGPTVGGVILSQWTASWLAKYTLTSPLAVFADEVDGERVIKRGYDAHVRHKKCLIVEDIINSGLTVIKTRDAILRVGGQAVGVGALCNRSGGRVDAKMLNVPKLYSLLDLNMEMFKEEECPICKERGVESVRTDLGKGNEFLTRIKKT